MPAADCSRLGIIGDCKYLYFQGAKITVSSLSERRTQNMRAS